MSLSSQAERLTRIALHTLIRSGLNAAEEIESSLLRQGVRLDLPDYRWAANPTINDDIAAYNAAVDRGEVPGRSIFGTKLRREPLPNGVAGVEEVRRVMNDVTEAYSELREASKLYCPRYEGSEPEFPFLPRTGRRQLRDGSTETRREHVFMLTLDIVRGTNSSQTPIMKDIIREIFQALAARGLSFQDTGDDAFVAWSETPVVLWDAALAVALRGEDLVVPGERFAGTRKGIMYGQVAEVQKPSGEKFIRDIHIPNVINQAFYVLAGADTVVDLQERNRILAVEYQTYERLAVALRLKRRHLRVVKVAAKHFAGKCVLVPLRALRA